MVSAEIITIGTELLLGEIIDTNTRYLARQLRQLGIDLFRVSVVGDNALRIADMIKESLNRCDIVITTGGLGPTVDDPTRSAVALAFNVDVVFHPELWTQIHTRFIVRGMEPTDNNKKQAFLPEGAYAINNPVGTAPAFYICQNNRSVICLPGVPAEMETIYKTSVIPLLKDKYSLNHLIKTRILRTIGMGESSLDTLISDLEQLHNPTVGLSAHPACVDIRITAKSENESKAEMLIFNIEKQIRDRLPDVIYGVDEDSITDKINELAHDRNMCVRVFCYGICSTEYLGSDYSNKEFLQFIPQNKPPHPSNFTCKPDSTISFGITLYDLSDHLLLQVGEITEIPQKQREFTYNGPPAQAHLWAVNTSLNIIWQRLKNIKMENT